MKTRILRMLRQSQDYVSGQCLCETLGVSRTAVWKVINQLKEEGYEFDAVSNKGYRIVKYPDLITKAEIESQLDSDSEIVDVVFYDETDSTNNQAKRAAEEGAAGGTLFVTESQTGGRGRRGRSWVSPPGSGIWMSLLLRPDIKPFDASMLTIVAALAMAKTIDAVIVGEAVTEDEVTDDTRVDNKPVRCKIKWPNDIVIGDKKICGMLTEMSAETDCVNYVVIGIGININTTDFDDSIKDMASSLYVQTGRRFKRSQIIARFARDFHRYYSMFLEDKSLKRMVDEYNESLVNVGREVKIVERDGEYVAEALGMNEDGHLVVKKADGSVCGIVAGEVSVRGLYGYV